MLLQAEFKKQLAVARDARRLALIASVEQFVAERHDQKRVSLAGLALLSTRELEWLAGAIDNCGDL